MQLFQGINVVSIAVTDLDLAREFYGTVLGLGTPLFDLPAAGWIEFTTGSPAGNLAVTTAAPTWTPNIGTTIVLNTPDCVATCAERAPAAPAVMTLLSFRAMLPIAASMILLATVYRCAARPRMHRIKLGGTR